MEKDGLRPKAVPACKRYRGETALATGGSMIFGLNHARAMATTILDPHAAGTLPVMAHDLFPHDRLAGSTTRSRSTHSTSRAASDEATRLLPVQGVTGPDAAQNMPWIDLSDGAREAVLRR